MPGARRQPLNRDVIIEAALAIADADGLDKLSMRRLGQRLGVDPMAVYHYVPGKAALLDGIVERIWRAAVLPPPAGEETWQDVLHATFTGLRERLLDHPQAVVLLGTRPSATAGMMRLIEDTLARLAAAGLTGPGAMQLIDSLTGLTVGMVLLEAGGPQGSARETVGPSLAERDLAAYPNLGQVLADGYGHDPAAAFDRALRAVISGWA